MSARLLVYTGWLAFSCFGLVGCGEEARESSVETVPEDVVVRDIANLVRTVPASGEYAAEHQPVVLHFDKEPLAVTVNGTAARVEANKAAWCFPNPNRDLGNQLFHIKWTNPDSSLGVGTSIRLTVVTIDISPPSITAGSFDGTSDVDPDPLNRDGIWYSFDEPVIGLEAELVTEDGEDLGWEVVWDDRTVTFRPGANGELLENGKTYIIRMVIAEPWIYNEFACECMDCSWYKHSEWTIRFVTADK